MMEAGLSVNEKKVWMIFGIMVFAIFLITVGFIIGQQFHVKRYFVAYSQDGNFYIDRVGGKLLTVIKDDMVCFYNANNISVQMEGDIIFKLLPNGFGCLSFDKTGLFIIYPETDNQTQLMIKSEEWYG